MKPSARPSIASTRPPELPLPQTTTEPLDQPGPHANQQFVDAWNGTATMAAEADDDSLDCGAGASAVRWADATPQAREHGVGDLELAGRSIYTARGVGDLDVTRELEPTRLVRDQHGTPKWIQLGPQDREIRRRTADLVLAGHSHDSARRLAPTTITPPSECQELIDVPLTAAERALSKKRTLELYMTSMSLSKAIARSVEDDRFRQASIDRDVANDRSRSPRSARAYAESRWELVDALIYRTMERSRRLRQAGVDESPLLSLRQHSKQ